MLGGRSSHYLTPNQSAFLALLLYEGVSLDVVARLPPTAHKTRLSCVFCSTCSHAPSHTPTATHRATTRLPATTDAHAPLRRLQRLPTAPPMVTTATATIVTTATTAVVTTAVTASPRTIDVMCRARTAATHARLAMLPPPLPPVPLCPQVPSCPPRSLSLSLPPCCSPQQQRNSLFESAEKKYSAFCRLVFCTFNDSKCPAALWRVSLDVVARLPPTAHKTRLSCVFCSTCSHAPSHTPTATHRATTRLPATTDAHAPLRRLQRLPTAPPMVTNATATIVTTAVTASPRTIDVMCRARTAATHTRLAMLPPPSLCDGIASLCVAHATSLTSFNTSTLRPH